MVKLNAMARVARALRWTAPVVALGLAVGASAGEPIDPIPQTLSHDPRRAALGAKLFVDKRLSQNNQVACVSCHDLGRGGADSRRFSLGVNQAEGKINAPTVFNSAFNFRQFWDGRASSLHQQVDGPVHDPAEMATDWSSILEKLGKDSVLVASFRKSYAEGLSADTAKDAMVNFQRTLNTPNSRFDRWLRGDAKALTKDEIRGYQLFKSFGCAACHQGVNAGGNMYQTFGVMGDYFSDRGNVTREDLGRFNVTGDPRDKHVFKVPSLRNVALTAPYFHDGSAQTLDQAVAVMFRYQLGRKATEQDRALIIQFLRTLTGEYLGKPLSTSKAVP